MYRLFPQLALRRDTPAGVLSGGEQQMLALARALMGDPDLLIVDEPTEGLAPQLVTQVADFLLVLRERGVSVLLIEQKLPVALRIADRCLVMGHGRVVFAGAPAALPAATMAAFLSP
jgi:branched-chain amino acid transport system ATP-binding protein